MSQLRSLYLVYDGDDPVGYFSIKSGSGGICSLTKVGIFEDKPHRGEMANGGFYSEEADLLAIPSLWAGGKLLNLDSVRAERCVGCAQSGS
ncbi:hypothetical protein [Methylorubrum extorquens]